MTLWGRKNMKEIAAIILLLGLEVGNSIAVASVLPYAITPMEMMRLPPSCAVKMKSDMQSPEYRAWHERIGKNFMDFHHYCHGINFINRYWGTRNANERNYYLVQAKGEFDYMVKAEKPDFTMSSELYSYRGEVLKLMGKPGEAIRDFNRAITVKPKFLKSYLQLADLYLDIKDEVRALEVIIEGLRNIPDSKTLQRRYLELGGKEPFPEPLVTMAMEPESAKQTESTSEPATPTQTSSGTSVTPASEQSSAPMNSQPIGTPKNPYCRFCPPE